ncbi:YojF family protein [Brevibacillus panacihumi]|uniref:YojF family protein n=1 Tax=Brevibacillus panacihumi TaxID=497735 RepID=UPI003D020948
MQPISPEKIQPLLEHFCNRDVYLHLETTNGSYAVLRGEKTISVGSFVRNVVVRFERGMIAGNGPYRVGLKMEHGWIYAEGLTDWDPASTENVLLMAGHDEEGRLMIAFQLSVTPFGTESGEKK